MKKLCMLCLFCLLASLAFAVRLEGKLVSHGLRLGDQKLVFVDAKNNRYESKTNFLGDYALDLPQGYYKIALESENYRLADFHQKIYSLQKPEHWDLQAEEIKKLVEGRIIDQESDPVQAAEILLKYQGGEATIVSDAYGRFSVELPPSVVTIFVRKEGFLPGGALLYTKENLSFRNVQIVLQKQYSHIRGIVTNGLKALSGVPVRLRNRNLEVIEEVYSDSLGYYEFSKVEQNRELALSVYEEGYQEYLSEFFYVNRNYDKKHIILEKNEQNVI